MLLTVTKMNEPEFTLYDLRVETIEGDRPFVCSHETGLARLGEADPRDWQRLRSTR